MIVSICLSGCGLILVSIAVAGHAIALHIAIIIFLLIDMALKILIIFYCKGSYIHMPTYALAVDMNVSYEYFHAVAR